LKKRRPDITFSPEKLQSPLEVNPPQPQAHDSAYDGIATFTFGGASTSSQMPSIIIYIIWNPLNLLVK